MAAKKRVLSRGQRPPAEERDKRRREVARLIRKGVRSTEVIRTLAEKYSVGPRTIENDIQGAWRQIVSDHGRDQEVERHQLVAALRFNRAELERLGDSAESDATRVRARTSAVTAIEAELKALWLDRLPPDGGLSDDEVRADVIARLIRNVHLLTPDQCAALRAALDTVPVQGIVEPMVESHQMPDEVNPEVN